MINDANIIPIDRVPAYTRAIKIGNRVFPLAVYTGTSGGGAEFYKCAAVYGPYDVETVVISGCPVADANGEYLPTDQTTTDWEGKAYPVYANGKGWYYGYSEYGGYGITQDFNNGLTYSGEVGGTWYDNMEYMPVEGMTGVKGSATLDTDVPKTWDGYKAVMSNGVYTFENTVTEGLTYSDIKPKELGVYSADGSVRAEWILSKYPTEDLIFFAPLTERIDKAEVGRMTVKTDAITIENGMAKFLSRDNNDVIMSDYLPFGYPKPEITLYYQFIATHDFSNGDLRNLPQMRGQYYAFIDKSTLKFFNKDECAMTISRNTLYSVTMVCKSDKWKVFVNNELKFSDVSYGMFRSEMLLCVGGFDGYLKNIMIYNRALSNAEISQLVNAFTPTT